VDYLFGLLEKEERKMSEKTWIEIQTEPVKELKKKDLKLAASKRIMNDNGLTLFSVTGNQQSGKSAYGMCILSEMYDNDVAEIMRHIVMSSKDFTALVEAAIEGGYKEKCIMWDDMSVGGSAATWITDPLLVKYLSGLGDTLGIATKGLILTSPSGDMIKAFRNYTKYKVLIGNGSSKYQRVARAYWIGKSPMDQRWCSSEFEDSYDTRIPFYEIYAQKRKEISLSAVKQMKKIHQENGVTAEVNKPQTITARAKELYRDWKAGVFGDETLVTVAKVHKIGYSTLKSAKYSI
jgi:hypothetical protein